MMDGKQRVLIFPGVGGMPESRVAGSRSLQYHGRLEALAAHLEVVLGGHVVVVVVLVHIRLRSVVCTT